MGITTAFYLHMLMLCLCLFAIIAGPCVIVMTIQDILRRRAFVKALERATGAKL
jgi:hypothetical protein